MTAFIGRREFITLLGGAAAAWPIVARAQQPERMRRIGMLLTLAADDPETKDGITVFQQQLQQAGWSDGRNVQIEYRVAEGDADRIVKNAAELVAAAPEVISLPVTCSLRLTNPLFISWATEFRKRREALQRKFDPLHGGSAPPRPSAQQRKALEALACGPHPQ